MEYLTEFVIILLAAAFLAGLYLMRRHHVSFTKTVFTALTVGIVFGFGLQEVFGTQSKIVSTVIDWLNIVGDGYIALLQTLVIPLIFVSLVGAFAKLVNTSDVKKISASVLTTLLLTTAAAALIGIGSVFAFHLQGADFISGTASQSNLALLKSHQSELGDQTLPQQILSFLPTNIFADFAGTRATSTIAVVIFSLLVGGAFLAVRKREPQTAAVFAKGIHALQAIVHQIVKFVIKLTPYGILALMTRATATSSIKSILNLGIFIIAAYAALLVVLLLHTVILAVNKIDPLTYYKKAWPALIFAFTSRTSAGTLPLNVQIQTEALGISPVVANFASSFGLTIGQNGCAGVYPAMIATIIAPTVGVNVFSFQFILSLIAIVTLSSFGVAGVGGGATFTTLMVLGALNLPVEIMGVIIAIDPIVDMARTLVNVNDSILAGLIAAKQTGQLDNETLKDTTQVVESTL